jgi:hypothetical protein
VSPSRCSLLIKEENLTTTKIAFSILATSGWMIFAQPVAPVRLTVPPGVESAIPIRTLPNSVCTLLPEGPDSPAQALTLYADQEGIIRFHVRPASQTDGHARLEIQCRAGGQVAIIPVELRAHMAPMPSMPAPVDLSPRSRSGASSIRPALEGDPMQISDSELRGRGYPPRPDPGAAPEAYASWLKAVTRAVTVIAPQNVVRTDRVHGPARLKKEAESIRNGPASSTNWSGFVATGNPGTYNLLAGDWIVPSVSGEYGISAYSSLWIGLDGWLDGRGNHCTKTTCDVVQDGTEQDVLNYYFFGIRWEVSVYYPWAELFPDSERQLPNFQVSPGDQIFSEVWFDGSNGWFYLENVSKSTSIEAYEPLKSALAQAPGSTATFVGNSAEWIMERPTLSDGSLPDLALYSVAHGYPSLFYATMIDAFAYRNGNWVAYGSDPNLQLSMYNGNDLLSTVSPDSCAGCMTFFWEAFH